jgi:hypothetical protein
MRVSVLLAALLVLGLAAETGSQIVPITGAVGYDPEIGTVMDGVVHDVRPTVSADRRYVQIDIRSGLATIEDITEFEVVTGGIF